MRFIIIVLLYNAIFLSLFPDRLLRGTATPVKDPPCNLAKYSKFTIDHVPVPIDVARSCLTSFPYDAKLGKSVVNTIIKALNKFYVFLDSANEPPKPGNTYNAINVEDSLKKLLKQDYNTDFEFMLNVTKVLDQLKDAHTSLYPECYQVFIFVQGLDLYSVVGPDGKQSIKVFKDFFDHTNNDCDVLQIDGVPALQAIKQFADENIGLARDLGVRFNMALNSLSALGTSEFSNIFSRRQYLPPSNEVTYELQCSGKKKKVVRKWTACADDFSITAVNDNETYWERNCRSASFDSNTRNTHNTRLSYRKIPVKLTKQKRPTSSSPENTVCTILEADGVELKNAKILYGQETVAQFYHLPKQNTGVLASNFVFETEPLLEGLQKFIDKGVKKVIFDLTNNPGGVIDAAHFLNKLLFPETDPNFETDFKLSDLMRLSIQKSNDQLLTFPGNWLDPQTEKPFKDAKSLIGNNTYTRGGVSENYTSRFIDSQQYSSKTMKLPWKATDYAILTNGFCGSACSLIATHLAEENNVLTISVGGLANTSMAFASFTAGQVFSLGDILDELETIGLADDHRLAPHHLRINGELTFAIREAYSRKNPNEVLEFSYRPATKRLYYDCKSARDPSELWVQVANLLQK